MQLLYTYNYTGAQQSVMLNAGTYAFKLWGAQGGSSVGGKGGYAYGEITLPIPTTLYIYIGGQPVGADAGWNGGGGSSGEYSATGGGGATDIRIGGTSLSDRVLVAGGGGGRGSNDTRAHGHGGGLIGKSSEGSTSPGTGGTQNSGGETDGALGVGGYGWTRGGGGGGYYGGGAAPALYGGGGGGSSYYGNELVDNGSTITGENTGDGVLEIWLIESLSGLFGRRTLLGVGK